MAGHSDKKHVVTPNTKTEAVTVVEPTPVVQEEGTHPLITGAIVVIAIIAVSWIVVKKLIK